MNIELSHLAYFSLDDAAPVRGAGSGSGYSAEDLAEMMRGSIVDSDEDAIGAGGDGGSPGE